MQHLSLRTEIRFSEVTKCLTFSKRTFVTSYSRKNEICVLQKLHFLWAFQAETLFVCPKPCTRTKFRLEILTINVITGIVYFREIILESSRNVSETTPRAFYPDGRFVPRYPIHTETHLHHVHYNIAEELGDPTARFKMPGVHGVREVRAVMRAECNESTGLVLYQRNCRELFCFWMNQVWMYSPDIFISSCQVIASSMSS